MPVLAEHCVPVIKCWLYWWYIQCQTVSEVVRSVNNLRKKKTPLEIGNLQVKMSFFCCFFFVYA